jgi:FkbM family methyltransferase
VFVGLKIVLYTLSPVKVTSYLADWIVRPLFILWAKSGVAHGLLYAYIEKMTGHFVSNKKYKRKLFNGLSLLCDLNDHVQQKIYFFGSYEPVESYLFLSLLNKGDVAVDAGGNIGFYSLMMAEKVGAEGCVHSFEPVPSTYLKLKTNVELNPQVSNVRINKNALWNKEEELHFSLSVKNANNCGGYSASAKDHSIEQVNCQAFTLENYFNVNHLHRLDALKMDIEGAELAALEGASKVLENYRPIVLLEVYRKACEDFGYSPNSLWRIFQKLDYKAYLIGSSDERSGWIDDFSKIEQSNVLLVPSEATHKIPTQWEEKKFRQQYLRYH